MNDGKPVLCRSRRDCGNLEAVGAATNFVFDTNAAVAATAAILRRRTWQFPFRESQPAAVAATAAILRRLNCAVNRYKKVSGRSRRDCGNLEAGRMPQIIKYVIIAAVAATAAILRR